MKKERPGKEIERWHPENYEDEQLQLWLNEMGKKAETLIKEKTTGGNTALVCSNPRAVINIVQRDRFEYRKPLEDFRHEIIHIPGLVYDIAILHLNGYVNHTRIQKADGFGWHILSLQTKAYRAGCSGTAYEEFRNSSARDFYNLLEYLVQSKPLEI